MSQSGEDDSKNQSDSLSIFCREVRNLLRSKPNCVIPFSKFVPAYHNHYGRQCCVYQFGYTKLIELLESIPHVVQIIGDGTNRYITLTHREQIKRFASDLIKVVKSQPGKKLKLSQFAKAYEQVLGRAFRVEDYGTNNINVLLAEIWEGTINIMPIKREFCEHPIEGPLFVGPQCADNATNTSHQPVASSGEQANNNKPYITEQYPDAWFEIPKRERSDKEIKRTKYFVWDVIELLSNMEPDHSVPFSKFIPNYHYYFNRQCKVSIFGFSKLIDLFESISPNVVEILDQGPGEEKIIKLADQHLPKGRDRNRARHHSKRSTLASANNNHPGYKSNRRSGSYSPGGRGGSGHYSRYNSSIILHYSSPNATRRPNSSTGLGSRDNLSPIKLDDEEEKEEEGVDVCCDEDELASNRISYDDDDDDEEEGDEGDDLLVPVGAIDRGPTEEELLELEDELRAYEELKALQSKRSARMAAILDIFKYSIY